MTSIKLFNLKARNLKRVRKKISGMFLQVLARDEILERLEDINRSFEAIAIVTGFPEIWSQRLPKANLIADSDTLDLAQKEIDLIIHAMALPMHYAMSTGSCYLSLVTEIRKHRPSIFRNLWRQG